MNKLLVESIADAPVKQGNRWRTIVARPGTGSSGIYSEELFRRDAHKILAPGAQSFINHDDSRNPKDMIGTFPEGSYWDEDVKAVVSELEVFPHWKEFVETVGPHCGMSIYAMGNADEDGNVIEFIEDRLNGCDLVARPGLVGSGLAEKLYESARAQASETTTTAVEEKKDNEMDEKAIGEAIASALAPLAAKLDTLVATKENAEAVEAQAKADAEAVAKAVEAYDAAVKAVDEADLLKPQADALLEAAKRGEDITAAIESAKAIKEAAVEAARVSEGAPAGRDFGARKFESATDLGKVFG